ncbi:MAG: hypothetical protein PHP63_07565 [Candidatus Marinimicrobia bacterium]|nr:hypothetical protein [Candidatus Neomarinimicrobiota bacterium]
MIIGIVGQVSQVRDSQIPRPSDCGNGKTNLMVSMAYHQFRTRGRKVITNFHTKYPGSDNWNCTWSEFMTAQEIFEHFLDPEYDDALVCISELSGILHSAARSSKTIQWVDNNLNQRRKAGHDLIWDAQRWMSNDKILRDKTDYIYVPVKFHCVYDIRTQNWIPTTQCPKDICDEKHLILVWQDFPAPDPEDALTPIKILHAWEIGELYDTKERITDQTLHAPA